MTTARSRSSIGSHGGAETVVVIWAEKPTVSSSCVRCERARSTWSTSMPTSSQIRSVVDRAIQHGALAREVRRLRGEVERARGLGEVSASRR